MLDKYKHILWDFDGVIIDSDRARVEGFRTVLGSFPADQVAELLRFHSQNGGLSRYVKFRYFFEQIRKEEVSEKQILQLADDFSEIMRVTLTDRSLLIPDSVRFIKKSYQRVPLHIVSGSDGQELRFLCRELGIDSMFRSIEGSPVAKTQLVANLIGSGQVQADQTCLIGDAGNDFEAAMANGIDFFGYNNPSLRSLGSGYITSFERLMV
ncbi:MAG: HAD family hydrolase [Bacteroidia bacterium]